MDYSSLFPSTDNLFKFIFLTGIIMVFTAMIYPLQKQQEIEVEILSYNQKVESLNSEIDDLTIDCKLLDSIVKKRIIELTVLSNRKKNSKSASERASISNQMQIIKNNVNTSHTVLKGKEKSSELKSLSSKYEKRKIELLQKYANKYEGYTCFFLWVGIPLACAGLVSWICSTWVIEKIKWKESKRS